MTRKNTSWTRGTRPVAGIAAALLCLFLPASTRAQSGQMFIYPKNGQSQHQEDKDRFECHSWAIQQTGFDPSRAYPGHPTAMDPCLLYTSPSPRDA